MKVIAKNLDNQTLLVQLIEGDAFAFELMVREFSEGLLQYAFKLTKDRQQAEDLVQDVFINLWEHHSKLRGVNSLHNYVYGMLRHRFIRMVSRNNLHERTMTHLTERMEHIQYSILDVMVASDLQQTLSTIVDRLPENMRRVFILRGEDYTLREIAEALGLAEQTVKSYHAELNRRIKVALLTKHPDISHSLLLIIASELMKD
jgi:RNA polymerase sigma factor (sigma-70 family)